MEGKHINPVDGAAFAGTAPWLRRPLARTSNQIYKAVVVVWLTLSIASVVLATVTWIQLSDKLDAARDSVALREQLDGVLQALVDLETGQRGYSLTGNELFLASLKDNADGLTSRFERLADLSRKDPGMLRLVLELRAQAEASAQYHRAVVETRRRDGLTKAAEMVALGEGTRIMETARALAAEIRGMRRDLLADENTGARSELVRATVTSLVAGTVGVGAGLIALWLSRTMLRHQERERELVEARLEAERNSREKSAFLANMSHEIRTPMNAIVGFSEILESEIKEPHQRRHIQAVRASAASLLQLINDILDMSKIEAGVMELHLEPTDARELCEFLPTLFGEALARKGVKFDCHVADDLPRALLLDRMRLRQIMVNLVGNAIKFTDHGSIEVRVFAEKEEAGSQVTLGIDVKDTGVGIPQDKLEAIFTPFVQAGAHRDKERQGTGLGLAIVRRLTQTMGGTVTAVSTLGKGSAFSLRFARVAVSARLPAGSKIDTQRKVNFDELIPSRILVVDDNPTNCQLIAGMFAGSHHHLHFANGGAEAVRKASEVRPEIILMDIRMPGMDGRDALAALRRQSGLELVPVIAVTASSLLVEERELQVLFSGYVRKPFSKMELFDELAQFLPPVTQQRAGQSVASPEPGTTVWPAECVAELDRVLAEDWPGVRDSAAINECKALASKLEALGVRAESPALRRYARGLAERAELYDVVELETHLRALGSLAEGLKKGGGV